MLDDRRVGAIDVSDGSTEPRQLSLVRLWQKAIRVSGLPMSARTVAWALSTWMDADHGVCWPSHQSIAEAAGASVPTVRRAIAVLKKAGLLEQTGRGGRIGGSRDGMPNTYTARMPDHLRSRIERQGDHTERMPAHQRSTSVITRDHRSTQEVSMEGSPTSEPDGSPAPWVDAGLSWPRDRDEILRRQNEWRAAAG